MASEHSFREYDIIVADVLGFLLSKKESIIIKNFKINIPHNRFYYEMAKLCYSLSNKDFYIQTNWFDFIIKKIFFFKKDKIMKANKKTQGYVIDCDDFHKIIEISENKLSSIYYSYYAKRKDI